MYTCTVAIPYVDEFPFVVASLRQIAKHQHPEVSTEILILDQSGNSNMAPIAEQYGNVRLIPTERVDAGYPIDVAARMASGEYFCSLDADAFPIHKNWLYLPIKMIQKYKFSFVGKQTGLGNAYPDIAKFFHVNNYYRVSSTWIANELSKKVGFGRYHHRYRTPIKFLETAEIWKEGCDNGVVAQWYSDVHNYGPKLSLALNKILGMTNEQGVYGMVIDDLVFHMVFGYGKEWIKDFNKTLGSPYLALQHRIYHDGLSEELVTEILSQLKPHHPFSDREYWDAEMRTAASLTPEGNVWRDIEELKAN